MTAFFASPCDPGSFSDCDDVAPPRRVDLTFGAGVNRVLQSVNVGGSVFERATNLSIPPVVPDEVVFRRAGTIAGVDPSRQLLFFEQLNQDQVGTNQPLTLGPNELPLAGSPREAIADAMLSPAINRGIDNVFNNVQVSAQDSRNNIERIDYIISNGALIDATVVNLADIGFLILERGGNDAFNVAAITGYDPATGLPTSYAPLVQVPATAWGTSNPPITLSTAVMRDDGPAANPSFLPSHVVDTQNIEGVFLPLNLLLPAPPNPVTIFGFSLFATDVTPGTDLFTFSAFPQTTGNAQGGLDLVAGGFGLIRRTTIAPAGSLSLLKRITNLFGPANLPNFNQFVGDGAALALLQNNNLGQGLDVITDPAVQAGNGIEYTVYFANSGSGAAPNVVLCDQIPVGLTFDPNGYGPGLGIQAIAASSPPGPVVNYTNAADGDPGTFFAPGAALPPFCGTNQGNGAVVVNAANVAANQVGFIRFRTTVD